MSVSEQPKGPGLGDFIYDKLFHNYIWRSIFRSGYPNTPRNQMLAVATNVFLHLHPTRIHKTHVKITHTYCLGGLSFFMFLGLTVTGVLLMFYYVPSVDRAYSDIAALETNVRFGMLMRNLHRWMAHAHGDHGAPAHDARLLHGRLQAAARVQLGRRRHPARADAAALASPATCCRGTSWRSGRSPSARTSPARRPYSAARRASCCIGGFEVGPNALIRFYTLHVIGLPLLAAIFMAVHFWRIRRDGGLARPL